MEDFLLFQLEESITEPMKTEEFLCYMVEDKISKTPNCEFHNK